MVSKSDLTDRRQVIVALLSARAGGDKPPVLALAVALQKRGHEVHLLCDGDVHAAVAPTRLPSVHLPRSLEQAVFYHPLHIPRMAARGETIDANSPDPLLPWAHACFQHAVKALEPLRPALLLSTLFCMPLAEMLASKFTAPWVCVNPGCYFGDDAHRPWEADYPGIVADMFRHWLLPPTQRATAVLHATDPIFDPPPEQPLPNHHFVGPLELETAPNPEASSFLDEPGEPWVLVTLSTLPQTGDMALARAALSALANDPVRVLLTLAPGHARDELGPVPSNARVEGFVPHGLVLDKACMIIGHAGHGMVMNALRHGVPMVLVPWGRDQTAVAARAANMGIAEVVPRSECTAESLAKAVARVRCNPLYADIARRASTRLRADDPLRRACSILEGLLEMRRRSSDSHDA
jgi:UDP:flavonoid glycosyltransferase YjiC (YdhE family)